MIYFYDDVGVGGEFFCGLMDVVVLELVCEVVECVVVVGVEIFEVWISYLVYVLEVV